MIKVTQEKCPTLLGSVTATSMKFSNTLSLLSKCHKIYDQLFIDEDEIEELGTYMT